MQQTNKDQGMAGTGERDFENCGNTCLAASCTHWRRDCFIATANYVVSYLLFFAETFRSVVSQLY